MTVEIITPEKQIFFGETTAVRLPGEAGLFEVLNNHAPIISTLTKGKIRVISGGETLFFEISGGVVEVLKNRVQALVEE
jgi:F-type H+-transporting ATPase subunit epsilon